MTKFCEDCPLRGQCASEIDQKISQEVGYIQRQAMGYGPIITQYHGEIGALLDQYGNPSEPIKFPPNRSLESIIGMVGVCDGPITETKGLIRKRNIITGCSSIGKLSLQGIPDLAAMVRSYAV